MEAIFDGSHEGGDYIIDNNKDQDLENEEKFFDGENYYTKEEFFNGDDEDAEDLESQASRRWIKVTVASILAIVLLGNILAFWPQVYNIAAIKFLIKSRELYQNENVQQYKQSVVVVSAGDSKGTGFNITADGYIITNHHVIGDEKFAFVRFPEGKSHRADIVASDPDIDIAILKINADGIELPVLEIALEQAWETGIPVYIIGNPLFFNYIANEGSILGLMDIRGWDVPVMAIEAPIYKGNSGSPVINHEGKVIGVVFATTKIEHDGSNKKVGLAVPVDYFEEYLDF